MIHAPSPNQNRVLIIGLDCAEPSLVFHKFKDQLPTLSAMMESGSWGTLRSTDPPLTIPAWSSMLSGYDPGALGCYGIRNRNHYSYDTMTISTSLDIQKPRIWDYAAAHNMRSILVGIPQTYPVKPISGCMISGMLTPDLECACTWPADLKNEIMDKFPGYAIDIENFRNISTESLRDQIWDMTEIRFRLFRHLIHTRPWDFAMMVEIGLDRLHHGFWHYWDREHPLHPGETKYSRIIPEYYRFLDTHIAKILEILPDKTHVFIVSDHGAQAMTGGFRLNQWLLQNGYLVLKNHPENSITLDRNRIDWSKTVAWGEGGYYGRIFLNIKDREPSGILPRSMAQSVRSEIARKLETIADMQGQTNRIIFPDCEFEVIHGFPPDIMVYFGNLSVRALEGFSTDGLFTLQNDRGPDGANHDTHGIFISNQPHTSGGDIGPLDILDITPSTLSILGIPVPDSLNGRTLNYDNLLSNE